MDEYVHLATVVARGPDRPACGTYGRQALARRAEDVTCPLCIEWANAHNIRRAT